MKKIIILFFTFLFMSNIVACGSTSSSAASSAPSKKEEKVEEVKELEVAKESILKTDGILPSEENPCGEEDEAKEVEKEPVEAPNQENYWKSDEEFDLYQYLTDYGFDEITETTDSLGPRTATIIARYGTWFFEIATASYGQYASLRLENSATPELEGIYYYFDYDEPSTQTIITVNESNDCVHLSTIEVLDEAIEGIIDFENSPHSPTDYPQIDGFAYP